MEADLSSAPGEDYRALSLWWDGLPEPIGVRPALPGDIDVDVAVVGGGLTGLWTAYYLSGADPGLRIAVLERDVVGFGASGRNGGWCSALFAASVDRLDRAAGAGAGAAMRGAMEATVEEVGRVVGVESIDCHFARGGTVVLARGPAPTGP
jgi:glycine/D-amino acid oxidase-like deaminating enzyme